jgi:hypothetical protein
MSRNDCLRHAIYSVPVSNLVNGLSKKKSLNNRASESDHSETAMNNLLRLTGLDLFGGHLLQQAAIKCEVARFTFTIVLVKGSKFDTSNGKEDLDIGTETHRVDGTKDVSVSKSFTRHMDASLLDNDTNNGEHANAAMLDFSPTSVFQVRLDIRPVKVK